VSPKQAARRCSVDRQMRSSEGVVFVRSRPWVEDTAMLVRYGEAGRKISGSGTSTANLRTKYFGEDGRGDRGGSLTQRAIR
jgi:hypothetical protein